MILDTLKKNLDVTGATANLFGTYSENSNILGESNYTCKPFTFTYFSSADAGLNIYNLGTPGTTHNGYTDTDRVTVALHEHGHFLSLGHSNYYGVMRDPYVGSISGPTSDDLAGINAKYP